MEKGLAPLGSSCKQDLLNDESLGLSDLFSLLDRGMKTDFPQSREGLQGPVT